MRNRRETAQKKLELLQDLRAAYHEGRLVSGDLAPPVRDLAQQYELSIGVVAQQLQVLEKEGLLYTVPRSGTFIGQPYSDKLEFYLFLLPNTWRDRELAQGFEEEVVRHGGTPLVMTYDEARGQVESKKMPPIAGLFYYSERSADSLIEQLAERARFSHGEQLYEVNFVDFSTEGGTEDTVGFDNFGGGRQATQYLMRQNHQRIAYLGIHAPEDCGKGKAYWSVQRMQGWQEALDRSGAERQLDLAFLPRETALRSLSKAPQLIEEAAWRLLRTPGITAVVTANDDAATRLLELCRQEWPHTSQWPAIVSFDNSIPTARHMLTSLRLPWEEVGRCAASILWGRKHGQITGEPVCRLLPLRIITRLSCRANWLLAESLSITG